MRRIITTCALSILTINAQAGERPLSPYISARIGIGTSDSYNYMPKSSGFGLMGAAGAQYTALNGINLRLELEYSKFRFDDSNSYDDFPFDKYEASYDLNSTFYLTNFYMEVLKDCKIKLYAGIALGLAVFDEKLSDSTYFYGHDVTQISSERQDGTSFAGGLHAGIRFDITDNISSDIGARCIEFGKSDKIRTCDANVAIRYAF